MHNTEWVPSLSQTAYHRPTVGKQCEHKDTGCFKKNVRMFVCLISPKPMNKFPNRFYLLKTEIHMEILNTESILCYFRGLRYLKKQIKVPE